MDHFKKKLIIDSIIAVLILGAIIAGIIFFQAKAKEFSFKLTQARQRIATNANSVERLANMRQTYNTEASVYLTVLYNVVPQKDELINLSRKLQTIAQLENLEFGFSFTGETAASQSQFGMANFVINIRGTSVQNVTNFINRLEAFQNLITITDIQIGTTEKEVSASIKGGVHFRP
jgi:Tfp pilus assembly protein PilV